MLEDVGDGNGARGEEDCAVVFANYVDDGGDSVVGGGEEDL